MKRLMVTGGAGFIGSNLVDLLVRRGYEVVVLDDLSTGSMSNLERHIGSGYFRMVEKDICDIDESDLFGIGAVFHLAARVDVLDSIEDPMEDERVNYKGTLNVLERCRKAGVNKVMFTSSAAVYGDVAQVPTPEGAPKEPLSPYGNHKYASGNMLRMYNVLHGMENVVFRLFNVYGPRQDPTNPYSGVISKFMEWAVQGRDLTIYGDGGQTRDFVYVMDVAKAFIMAYEKGLSGTFNVGLGAETSINGLARKIIGITGSDSGLVHEKNRSGEIYRSCCVNRKLKEALGWVPDTTMEEGLKEYYDHLG